MLACLGAFMATIDTSIVNIALPAIGYDFHSSLENISWVVVVYLLINGSMLITSGRLGDLLPTGRVFLAGLVVFTGASALCGLSPSLAWLVVNRACQGLGAALMLGVAPRLIVLTYADGERGMPLGLLSTGFAAGISVGAPLGGLLTAYLGWRWVFFVNLPLCALALMLGAGPLLRFGADTSWSWRRLDLKGNVLLAASFLLLLLALTRVRQMGGAGLGGVLLSGGAAILFVVLLFLERRADQPLLPPELWRSRSFVLGSTAVVLAFAGVMGAFFLLPFLLDQVYHYPSDQAGFLLAILSLTNATVSPLGGFLADRLGNLRILRLGSVLILLGLASFFTLKPESTTFTLAARLALTGLGFGLFQAPNLNEILRQVEPAQIGLATSTNSALKNLGSLLGVTLMVMVFAGQHHQRLSPGVCLGLSCFQQAFAVASGVAALNLLNNLWPRRRAGKQ